MEELIQFIHELLNIVEKIMSEHLLFQENGDIQEFDTTIQDNPSRHDAGYYFGLRETDAWNKWCIRMIQRIRTAKLDDKWFEYLGDAIEFSEAAKDEYNKWDIQFCEILALLMMFTCGLSGRGMEMTSLRWLNTMDGDRSIYVEDHQIMFVTEYHKSMMLIDDQKVCMFMMMLIADYSTLSAASYQSDSGCIFTGCYAISVHV